MWGPIIATVASSFLGRSNARYSQRLANKSDGSKLQRMVKDARKAGINPYAALMGGAGASGAGPGPRVISDTAIANSFDQIDEILTGQHAEQQKQAEFTADLARIDVDRARTGAIPTAPQAPTPNPRRTDRPTDTFTDTYTNHGPRLHGDGAGTGSDWEFDPFGGRNATHDGRQGNLDDEPPISTIQEMVTYMQTPDGRQFPVIEEPEMAVQVVPQAVYDDFTQAVGPRRIEQTRERIEQSVRQQMPYATDQEIADNVDFLMQRQARRLNN